MTVCAVSGGVRMDEAGEQLTSLFSFHQRLSQLAAAQGKKKGQAAPSQAKVILIKGCVNHVAP